MPAKGQMSDTVPPEFFDGLRCFDLIDSTQSSIEGLRMNFTLFALVIAAAFFVSSLILLNFGRHLGLRPKADSIALMMQRGMSSMMLGVARYGVGRASDRAHLGVARKE